VEGGSVVNILRFVVQAAVCWGWDIGEREDCQEREVEDMEARRYYGRVSQMIGHGGQEEAVPGGTYLKIGERY
jgi:hypothetical protein